MSPGQTGFCPRDKVGLSQGQTQVFSLLYTVEAQFVPGTNPVCNGDIPGTKGGRKSLCVKKFMCLFRSLFSVVLDGVGRDVPGFGSGRPGFGKTLCEKALG